LANNTSSLSEQEKNSGQAYEEASKIFGCSVKAGSPQRLVPSPFFTPLPFLSPVKEKTVSGHLRELQRGSLTAHFSCS
jgi:hypothetical protein